LDLGAAGAAGAGAIGFAPSLSGTLDFAASVAPANTITGFGLGTPTRDVFLSPDHAIYAGVLIPIKCLINGTTVQQIEADHVSYFHIELTRHAVVLADNLPAESYCDTGDRTGFANAGVATDLHPAWSTEARDIALLMDATSFAPLRVTGAEVRAVRALLARRERLPPDVHRHPVRAQLGMRG
jgi:hypothetical protein